MKNKIKNKNKNKPVYVSRKRATVYFVPEPPYKRGPTRPLDWTGPDYTGPDRTGIYNRMKFFYLHR